MPLPRVLAAVLMLGSLVTTARAQATGDRAALDRFRVALRDVRDTAALTAVETPLRDTLDHHHGGALVRMRLGFVNLRRGELAQDDGSFHDAQDNFDAVVGHHPGWPLALVGRGLARLNLASSASALTRAVFTILAGDPGKDAARDLARSALLDSTCTGGLLDAAADAAYTYQPSAIRVADMALSQVAASPAGRQPTAQLARSRIALLAQKFDTAVAFAQALVAREPDSADAWMALGTAEMTRGDIAGAAAWFHGLAIADSAVLQLYRSDVQLVFPDSARTAFDSLRGSARADHVRNYFELDDPEQIRTAAERLREHYIRLEYARRTFPLPGRMYAADGVPSFNPGLHGVDERGLVWVLHGEPDAHTHVAITGGPPNESWHYSRPDGGEFLFHFVKTDDVHGYRRVPSLFDILALSTAARTTGLVATQQAAGLPIETYGAGWTAQTAEELLSSRDHLSPTYEHLYSKGRDSAAALQRAERATGDSSMAHGETWTLRYELPLEGWIEPVAVGHDSAGPLVHVGFAISGSTLYAAPTTGAIVYPVRMRVTVIGKSGLVARIDTTRNFVASRPVGPQGLLLGTLPVHVPSGTYVMRVALQSNGRGMVAAPDTVHVAALDGSRLALSAIALGLRSEVHWVGPGADSIWFNPRREFTGRERMQLYFEVGGLDAGMPYHVELSVLRARDQHPELRLGFEARASGQVSRVRREISLNRLARGDYQLQVVVSTPAAGQVTRSQRFTVVR